MINLNGKRFYKNAADSLFVSGGTANGTYKNTKKRIILYNLQGKVIASIVKGERILVKATKTLNGYWYSYGTPEVIGEFTSYEEEKRQVIEAIESVK